MTEKLCDNLQEKYKSSVFQILKICIDNVPTLYQSKYSKNNRINYLPTQFRYLKVVCINVNQRLIYFE